MSGGKHLTKGSPKPIIPDDGLLRLYTMRFCPFAQRAHLVLNYKKIPYHSVFINLTEKPEWLPEVSCTGKVPALQLVKEPGQPAIVESLVVCEYLDEKYPENPLIAKDPLQRAKDRLLLSQYDRVPMSFLKAILRTAPLADLWTDLYAIEQELAARGTTYFSGAKPGYVDYMVWPWIERLGLLKIILADDWHYDEKKFVQLARWTKIMEQDEVVQSFYVDPETHAKFIRSRSTSKPEYDLLADA